MSDSKPSSPAKKAAAKPPPGPGHRIAGKPLSPVQKQEASATLAADSRTTSLTKSDRTNSLDVPPAHGILKKVQQLSDNSDSQPETKKRGSFSETGLGKFFKKMTASKSDLGSSSDAPFSPGGDVADTEFSPPGSARESLEMSPGIASSVNKEGVLPQFHNAEGVSPNALARDLANLEMTGLTTSGDETAPFRGSVEGVMGDASGGYERDVSVYESDKGFTDAAADARASGYARKGSVSGFDSDFDVVGLAKIPEMDGKRHVRWYQGGATSSTCYPKQKKIWKPKRDHRKFCREVVYFHGRNQNFEDVELWVSAMPGTLVDNIRAKFSPRSVFPTGESKAEIKAVARGHSPVPVHWYTCVLDSGEATPDSADWTLGHMTMLVSPRGGVVREDGELMSAQAITRRAQARRAAALIIVNNLPGTEHEGPFVAIKATKEFRSIIPVLVVGAKPSKNGKMSSGARLIKCLEEGETVRATIALCEHVHQDPTLHEALELQMKEREARMKGGESPMRAAMQAVHGGEGSTDEDDEEMINALTNPLVMRISHEAMEDPHLM